MLVLVVGDAHIPERATSIPVQFQEILKPGKISQVVSVGNISDAGTREMLRKLTPNTPIKEVPGEFDTQLNETQTHNTQQPWTEVFKAGRVRIGVVSGFLVVPADDIDRLSSIARTLDASILLWGGSHQRQTESVGNQYFINPGSLTGATNPATWVAEDPVEPSFCLLDVGPESCMVYMYYLEGKDLKIEKAELPFGER